MENNLAGANSDDSDGDGSPKDSFLPFAQQFRYRLKDAPIVSFESNFRPTGFVTIHLPNYTSIQFPFDPLELVEDFRGRLQAILDFDATHFHLVTKRGILLSNASVAERHIKPGMQLVLVGEEPNRIKTRATRDFWVRSREMRGRSPRSEHVDKTSEELQSIRRHLKERGGPSGFAALRLKSTSSMRP
jgi:hypothetical protein